MFQKLKQFKELRTQAKTLQNTLQGESAAASGAGGKIQISMDGNMKITTLSIEAELFKPEHKKRVEDGLKEAFEDATKKIQRIMAAKMKETGMLDKFKL